MRAALTGDDLAVLAALPGWAFGFALVLARVSAAVTLLPGVGEAELPMMVRAGIALAVTLLLLPGLAPLLPAAPADPARVGAMVAAEVLTGVWLGWLARMIVQALPMGAQIIAYMLGLANVLQQDPALGAQASVLARLFSLAAPAVLLATGLYATPLAALAGSFRLIEPGALLPAPGLAESAVGAVADAFALALRLAAPFVIASLVWQVGTGLLSWLVPRLQIYFPAMSGQILGGLLLLGLLAGGLTRAWTEAAHDGFLRLPGLN